MTLASTLSSVVTWRNVFVLLCLLNLKSLPFSWHIRLFYHFAVQVRQAQKLIRRRRLPRRPGDDGSAGTHPIFQSVSIYPRTPLYETDYNLHKSNSTYFVDLDVSRTALVGHIYGPALGKGGGRALEAEGYPGRISVMLGSVHTSFHREIKPYERYEVRSRVLGWDKKWLVVVSFFIRPARGGKAEELLASSLSKYVVKKKRFTISPERCLRTAGWLPPAPAPAPTEDGEKEQNASAADSKTESGSGSSSTVLVGAAGKIATEEGTESATPQSDNENTSRPVAVPETAAAAARVLESLGNAVGDGNINLVADLSDPKAEEWTWQRIEAERLRGLDKARAWLALDTILKEEYASSE